MSAGNVVAFRRAADSRDQRIERARVELERLKREAIDADSGAARFGPDCKGCRYSTGGEHKQCVHPAIQKVSIDWRGSVKVSGSKDVRDMRAENGLCGPESALFDRREFRRRVPWFAVAGGVWAVSALALALFVSGPLGLLAFFAVFGIGIECGEGRWA